MKRKDALKLKPGTRVKIRFAAEDTFTPMKYESGVVATFPINKGGAVFVDVRLMDELLVGAVKHHLIRLSSKKKL